MDNVLRKMRASAEKYGMLPHGGTVLAAVSGGADSVCLLHALHRLSAEMGFTLRAVHFNHQIRGGEADRDQIFVQKLCEELGIECHVGTENVPRYAREHGLGLEDAGRRLRYEFFDRVSENYAVCRIATAHNADDNCETVVMNMTRGAGLRGMCGIPPVRGKIVRPLLTVSRAEIEGYLAENALEHVEDSTNAHDDYTRNRVRHQVIPVLKEMNPHFAECVSDMTRLLSTDRDFLEGEAEKLIRGGTLSADTLRRSPEPIAARAVRRICPSAITAEQTRAAMALACGEKPSGRVYVAGGELVREYDILRFTPHESPKKLNDFTISVGTDAVIPEINARVICRRSVCGKIIYKSLNSFLFKSDGLCGTITVGGRRQGDRLTLAGRGVTKSVKKLMIEERIPPSERDVLPIVRDEGGVIGVLGLGQAQRTVPRLGDAVTEIIFEGL